MKRLLCTVLSHRYARVRYPSSPDGFYLRCLRCGHRSEEPYIAFAVASAVRADSAAHVDFRGRR
jgi:hypothetical protein